MSVRTSVSAAMEVDEGYAAFESLIRRRVEEAEGPLFTTDTDPDELWRVWLESIPAERRAHYNCHCCRSFIQKYGGLVYVFSTAETAPLLWEIEDPPPFFETAVEACDRLVGRAKVTGVFLWGEKERQWGTPECGGWTHLSGTPKCQCWSHPLLTAGHKSAELKQDYQILSHSLADYGPDVVAQAVRVLEAGAVYRSEKALGVAKWAADLHRRLDGLKGQRRANVLWLAVAQAPVGYCHLRSTVISTLLDDIKAGLPFDAISERWAKKLHPLQYQRPTAPPSSGAIAQAEKVFEAMGAASALNRRFATLADVQVKLWVPKRDCIPDDPKRQGGLFDHLRSDKQPVKELDLPPVPITFDKFRREVLPTASEVEVLVPSVGPFYGLVTAVDPEAKAILQWDGLMYGDTLEVVGGKPDLPMARNPVSWYFWASGSPASQWGLRPGQWAEVTCLFLSPHQWQQPEKFQHQGNAAHFALKACVESRTEGLGSGLFPEILRSEYHSVRSVIEAHSRSKSIQNPEDGTANGIAFQKGTPNTLTVRVRSGGGRASYRIDRWD